MNREDILRELELLPVWQLRKPLPQHQIEAKDVAMEADARLTIEAPVNVDDQQVEQVIEVPAFAFRLVLSQDAQWAFVLGRQDVEAEQLLQNILKAVNVNVSQDITDANLTHLRQHAPKVVVVMGEAEAQQLLNKTQSISEIRGTPHSWQGIPVIATYSPSHLLLNLADKAKAWEDLCLTKFTIASL